MPCQPIAAAILAAGAATRMGSLKQLLPYKGRTFIQHAVDQAIAAQFAPVIVVVGAQSELVRSSIASRPVQIVENPSWQSGMGSSVSAAARKLMDDGGDYAAVAILLADQPLVTAIHLKELRRKLLLSHAAIVGSEYNGVLGVPALFRRNLFARLAELPAEAGARQVLRQPGISVESLPLPEAGMDIDTPSDFEVLNAKIQI